MNGTIRRRPSPAVAILCAGVALAIGRGPAVAAPLKSDSVVKATAVAGKPDADGKQVVTLTLEIDKPWHLYANPVGLEELAGNETTVKAKAAGPVEVVKIDYPPGTEEKYGSSIYRIYEDKATITLTVTRARDDASPLELTVRVNACDKDKCLQSGQIKVTAAP